MNRTRKPRSDSRLKTLPEARQDAIVEYARSHSEDEVVAWLRADGLVTSRNAVSEFLNWYWLQQQFKRNELVSQQMIENLRRTSPTMLEEELARAGASFFEQLAIEQRDARAWKQARELRLKERALELMERRVKVAEAKASQADAARQVAGDGALSAEEKQQRMKEIFGL